MKSHTSQKVISSIIFAAPLLLLNLRAWIVVCFFILVVTAIVSLIQNRISFALTKQERWLIVIFVAAFLSTLLTYVLGNFTIPETTNLIHNMAFLGFVPVFILTKKNGLPQHAFWYGIVTGAILTGITALIEVTVLSHPRATGAHHHIIYGDHALLLGIMSLLSYSFFKPKGKYYLLLPFLGLLFGIMASVLSTARGSWIAVPVFLLILVYFFDRLGPLKTRISYLIIFLLLALIAFAIPQTGIKHRINLAVSDISSYQVGQSNGTSVGLRFEMWRASIELAKEKPFTGIGLRQYQYKIQELVDKSGKYEEAVGSYAHPHNEYLYALVERGVVGLLTILLILFFPAYLFFSSLRSRNESTRVIAIAGLIVTSGYIVFGLTEAIFNRPTTTNFYSMMMALLLGSLYFRGPHSENNSAT